MLKIGVIGFGYWGPNIVRNIHQSRKCKVTMVSDVSPTRRQIANGLSSDIKVVPDHTTLIADTDIDAIAIATPVSTHFEIARSALKAGKHVFVEKPITDDSEEARILIEEAEAKNLVLMVDHIFVYTGAVRKMEELISTGQLGDIKYYSSERINLGLFQSDVNVVWDLAVHDLSIIDYVFPQKPSAVSCTGMAHVTDQPENVAYLTIFFEGSMIAHMHVNWLAPVKIRRVLIGGSKQMIVYDDLEPSEKIKVYDKSIDISDSTDIYRALIGYRTGDMWAPKLNDTEALRFAIEHFVEAIEENTTPVSDGQSGLTVVKILEAATLSMEQRGSPIQLR